MKTKPICIVLIIVFNLASCAPSNTLTPETIQQPVLNIQNVKIGLDPGHGWGDSKTGAVGNGLTEKDVNLEIALLTKQILENNDIEVTITREGDSYDKKLYQAAEIINNESPVLVVSIHTNSGVSAASGTEACYTAGKNTDEQSKRLAQLLTDSISTSLSVKNRGIYPENSESVCGRGRGRLYIHEMNAPSTIIETGFLSNPTEAELLKNNKNEYAQAIAQAILNYLGIQRPMMLSAKSQFPEISVTIEAATLPPILATETLEFSLDDSDFTSVARWVSFLVSHNEPNMIANVIGKTGTKFGYFGMGANPIGYNNSEVIVTELKKGLEGSSPKCLGYNDRDMGTLPDKAIIIFKGINFDWECLSMSKPENDTVGFQFYLSDEKWELIWITPMPDYFWSDYHITLDECP